MHQLFKHELEYYKEICINIEVIWSYRINRRFSWTLKVA